MFSYLASIFQKRTVCQFPKRFLGVLWCSFFLCATTACVTLPQEQTLIFDYSDFGPQAMAQELLGKSWWQWQSSEESLLSSEDVQIIVYQGIPISILKKRYPDDLDKGRDYRYIKYEDALEYLNQKIDENVIPSLTVDLNSIRTELVAVFK